MRFEELEAEWDDDNIEHIAHHDVEPEEVEEIVYEDCHPSWVVRFALTVSEQAGVRAGDQPTNSCRSRAPV
jgi:hypothetical protein